MKKKKQAKRELVIRSYSNNRSSSSWTFSLSFLIILWISPLFQGTIPFLSYSVWHLCFLRFWVALLMFGNEISVFPFSFFLAGFSMFCNVNSVSLYCPFFNVLVSLFLCREEKKNLSHKVCSWKFLVLSEYTIATWRISVWLLETSRKTWH